MKSKTFLLIAVLFVVIGLPLMAGSQSEPGPTETTGTGEPQYGGTLTWIGHTAVPQTWDINEAFWLHTYTHAPFYEGMLEGDVFTYGPRGSNEFSFTAKNFVPEEYVRGLYAESWEVTPEQITFHLRKGIMWAEGPLMASRELVADDIAESFSRTLESRRKLAPGNVAWIDGVRAPDKYTVIIDTNQYDANWTDWVGYGHRTLIQPPEVQQNNPVVWRSHISAGTGPFLLKDYVEESHITYEKNPNWWQSPVNINGKDYEVPFVDTLRYVYPGDEAAEIAALRTGKIDWDWVVPSKYKETLMETSPDLVLQDIFHGDAFRIVLRVDEPPFDDINVRKAVSMATDADAVARAVMGDYALHAYPMIPVAGPAYTPMEELPASAKEAYEYNPEKAKKMLADAGYPNGFKAEILTTPNIDYQEAAEMVKSMWDAVGVETELVVKEDPVYYSLFFYPGDFKFAATKRSPRVNPLSAMAGEITEGNESRWTDEYAREQYNLATQETDSSKRTAMLKDLSIYMLEQQTVITLGATMRMNAWWPWVKNYYGEAFPAVNRWSSIQGTIWIDQDLKKSMGY